MATPTAPSRIDLLDLEAARDAVPALGALLHACVHAGASVGFVLPLAEDQAAAFWRDAVLPDVAAGRRLLWVARSGQRIVGTVQLGLATPPNQPHRADVAKLLVHPDARRRGLARVLMGTLEARARALGRTLLTLDTRTGDVAEPLYAGLGYIRVGEIPGYCLAPHDRTALESTTLFYKRL